MINQGVKLKKKLTPLGFTPFVLAIMVKIERVSSAVAGSFKVGGVGIMMRLGDGVVSVLTGSAAYLEMGDEVARLF